MNEKKDFDLTSIGQVGEIINELKTNLFDIADAIAEKKYQNSFLPILTLKDCIQFFKEKSQEIASLIASYGFILSVTKNHDPRNENDYFVVIQALLDSNNKPIVINGETISRTVHTKTIDDALIRAMDGNETRLFTI